MVFLSPIPNPRDPGCSSALKSKRSKNVNFESKPCQRYQYGWHNAPSLPKSKPTTIPNQTVHLKVSIYL